MTSTLLCIFDGNFELSVGVRHDFRYKPLVHDVLGLKKLDGSDPFWLANGSLEFPQVAEEIETQLNKYKKDLEEINMMRTGAYETDLIGNTKHLMNAVNSLPELKARKEMIDKRTNIATNLLGEIKERSLDVFTEEENEMMKGGSIDMSKVLAILNEKGTNEDGQVEVCHHVLLLSLETINQTETEAVEEALRKAEVDTRAFQYVKKIKSLNLSSTASADSASSSNVVDWAEKLYDHSISAVTAGVKNLLSSNQQLAVARTVEALAKGQPNLETDPYIMLDPKASKTGSSGCSHVNEPFREAIVFMVGGGNYIEYNSLQELSQRNEVVKNVITYNSFSSSIMQR